jgi:hypothetical protein
MFLRCFPPIPTSNTDKEAPCKMDDYKNDSKKIENAIANDPLARYSDAQKTKALRKLDWNLIPLYDFSLVSKFVKGAF